VAGGRWDLAVSHRRRGLEHHGRRTASRQPRWALLAEMEHAVAVMRTRRDGDFFLSSISALIVKEKRTRRIHVQVCHTGKQRTAVPPFFDKRPLEK
jgi:hypothetical protein